VINRADQTVSVRKVTLGPGDATNVAITQGLKAGELVVVDGADKLKEGAKVLLRQPGAAPAGTTPGAAQPQGQGKHGQRRPQQGSQGGG
jgi:membrane fusion protein, multidrug efflux system